MRAGLRGPGGRPWFSPARWHSPAPGRSPVSRRSGSSRPTSSLGGAAPYTSPAGPPRSPFSLTLLVAALIALVLVQVTWVNRLPTPGAVPDLVAISVLAIALAHGALAGAAVGAVAGLVLDLVPPAAGPLGGWMLVLVLAAALMGRAAATYRPGPIAAMVMLAVGSGAVVVVRAAVVWFAGGASGVSWGALLLAVVASLGWGLLLAPCSAAARQPPRPSGPVAAGPIDRRAEPVRSRRAGRAYGCRGSRNGTRIQRPTIRRDGPAMTDRAHARLLVLAVLVLSLVVTLAARAFSLQVLDPAPARAAAEDNRLREVVIPAARGMVLDQRGRTLAANRISLDVAISRRDLRRLDDEGRTVLDGLADLLDVEAERLAARLRNCGTPEAQPQPDCWNGAPGANPVIARDVGIDAAGAIMADPQAYPAVDVVESPVRDYPGRELAAHTLGHVAAVTAEDLADEPALDGIPVRGRAGLEAVYDQALRGTPGREQATVDSAGHRAAAAVLQPAEPGQTLVTNLDAQLQAVVQEQLQAAIERARGRIDPISKQPYEADGGAAVVLDVRTGAVLALASAPDFDANVWSGGISADDYAGLDRPPGRPAAAEPRGAERAGPRVDIQGGEHRRRPARRLLHHRDLPLPERLHGRRSGVPELQVTLVRTDLAATRPGGLLRHGLLPRGARAVARPMAGSTPVDASRGPDRRARPPTSASACAPGSTCRGRPREGRLPAAQGRPVGGAARRLVPAGRVGLPGGRRPRPRQVLEETGQGELCRGHAVAGRGCAERLDRPGRHGRERAAAGLAYAAIANGGTVYRPQMARALMAADGSVAPGFGARDDRRGRRPAQRPRFLRRALRGVIDDRLPRVAPSPGSPSTRSRWPARPARRRSTAGSRPRGSRPSHRQMTRGTPS